MVDFWVCAMYVDKMTNANGPCPALMCEGLKKFPNFCRYGEDFKKEAGIAAWLAKRPACPF
jgi:hypothetical protein